MKTKPEISMSLDAALGTSASVIITRLWQDRRWIHNGIYILTPASLRRVCRLLQGQSPFFDAEQMHDPEIDAMTDEERLAAVMATAGAWKDDPLEPEPVCEWKPYVNGVMQYCVKTGCGVDIKFDGAWYPYCKFCGRRVKVA